MSSILKALKKLEDEKSIRKPDSLKIDAEILRGDVSRRLSPMGISLLAALLFVCGSAATYVFMKPDANNVAGTNSPVSAVTPIGPSSPATAVAPVAEKPQHQIQTDLPKSDKIISVKLDNKLTPLKMPTKAQSVQPIKKTEVTLNSVPTKKASAAAVRLTAPVMTPSLKVNGIAYQNESADRVAIVNGVSVSNGSMIEGAKVEDIQQDRVRFSYVGEKFDVALGKSNRE